MTCFLLISSVCACISDVVQLISTKCSGQRIALSWMVHKETSGLNCSGGILADDQVDVPLYG
jgi:hypothetical protein